MKISGFTIVKNAVINDYPVTESIRSILPVVDEMIVSVGDSTDDTLGLIQSLNDPKIKIHRSIWDPSVKKGGAILALETSKAFQLIDTTSDWAFYIQADEVVHEKYHPAIVAACEKYAADKRVEGLLFNYLHFYGTYDYVGDSRRWYNREVRIIRNDKKISAYKDAQGFRVGNRKLRVKPLDAYVYHYGWVKSEEQMRRKMKEVSRYWHHDAVERENSLTAEFSYSEDFDSLQKFTSTHPAVMKERIANYNFRYDLDTAKKRFSFKDRLLYGFEKLTGIRSFGFRNYTIIR